jgi:hypothetical protein
MSLLAALLMVQVVRIEAPDPILQPSDPAAAFALFRRLCFEPFPDPAKIEAAIAASGPGFVRWQPSNDLEKLIPSHIWYSPSAKVSYIARGGMPSSLPDPQCTLKVTAPASADAEQLIPALGAALGIGPAKIVGHKAYRTGMWDLTRPGHRWRVILGTERRDGRMTLSLSMLNLKPEKK